MSFCHDDRMAMTTDDLYRLASDLAQEHGPNASDYASRAAVTLEAEGSHERAKFWFLMLVLLADIKSGRVDPEARITVH
jgi:hypothetical protein